MNESARDGSGAAPDAKVPAVEQFLRAVEEKTVDAAHRRLLNACRGSDVRAALEAELQAIAHDVLNET